MWSDASTTAMLTTLFTSVGSQLGIVITAVLAVAIGLIILGFAYRKTKKHVTGGKF